MKHEHQEWYLGNFLLTQNLTCSYSTGSFVASPSSLIPITTAIQCTRCLLHVASDESSSLRLSDLIIPVQSSLCYGHESWAMAVKHIVMSLHKRPFEQKQVVENCLLFFPSSFLQAVNRTRFGGKRLTQGLYRDPLKVCFEECYTECEGHCTIHTCKVASIVLSIAVYWLFHVKTGGCLGYMRSIYTSFQKECGPVCTDPKPGKQKEMMSADFIDSFFACAFGWNRRDESGKMS